MRAALQTAQCPVQLSTLFRAQVRRWLNDFNLELRPHGVSAKFFTFKMTSQDGNVHNDLALTTLVFALSPEEADVLKIEPVLQDGHCNDKNWGCWWCICHDGRVV